MKKKKGTVCQELFNTGDNLSEIISQCKDEKLREILYSINGTLPEALSTVIRNISEFDADSTDLICIIKVYIKIFLNISIKNPARKTLQRVFISFKDVKNTTGIILEEFSSYMIMSETDLERNNFLVYSLTQMLEIFTDFLDLFHTRALKFALKIFELYLGKIHCYNSPSAKSTLHSHIHNCSRSLMLLLQYHTIETLPELSVLSAQCVDLINLEDLQFETRNICGIILVLASNVSNENGYKRLLAESLQPSENKTVTLKSDLAKLCVYSGIITVVGIASLGTFSLNEKSALQNICDTLIEYSARSSSNPAVVLAVTRALQQFSGDISKLSLEDQKYVTTKCFEFLLSHLEDYVDTVRHLSRSIFVNIAKNAKKNTEKGDFHLIDRIYEFCFKISHSNISFYVSVGLLSEELGCSAILERNPQILNIINKNLCKVPMLPYACNLLESLICNHQKEVDKNVWMNFWISPLFDSLAMLEPSNQYLQRLVLAVYKLEPQLITLLMNKFDFKNVNQLESWLFCVRTARRFSTPESDVNGKWRGLIDFVELENLICHYDEKIRVGALSLIAESHKSTEIFTEWELEIILKYIDYNSNEQVPSARQQNLALFKKILTRWGDSFYNVFKKRSTTRNEADSKAMDSQIEYYSVFLSDMCSLLFRNLMPGGNYGRRALSLELLNEGMPLFEKHLERSSIWSERNIDLLKHHLLDSFETNKKLSVQLLKHCVDLDAHIPDLLAEGLRLASSSRPADTISAAYYFQVILNNSQSFGCIKNLYEGVYEGINTKLLTVNLLILELRKHLDVARMSLLKAASSSPMYGLLFCIRTIVESVDLNRPEIAAEWNEIIASLIDLCFDLSLVAEPIVNNSSPEGHLPMDRQSRSDSDQTATAQMLLLCAWRTIKEISLTLGEIASSVVIEGNIASGSIDSSHLRRMADYFTRLLLETKHRGAFEQAYVGFYKLCTRLWKCSHESLHKLPIFLLDEILDSISGKVLNAKLCSTRRSAGVPFMVQAIVTSEILSQSSSSFEKCMKALLKMGRDEEFSVETRIHSMNVLRALFRHTQLRELVMPYVASGITIAIDGFGKDTWAERNSSTLLFSCLIVRIFGVQRSKELENLSIHNKLTARMFFLRHPSLYEFILDKLKNIVISSSRNGSHYFNPVLNPVLLLLTRLYPSQFETDSYSQLTEFLPYVIFCKNSNVYKVRNLAARAMVPLLTKVEKQHFFLRLLAELCNSRLNRNTCNGVLQMALYVIREVDCIEDVNVDFFIEFSKWIALSLHPKSCLLNAALYMELLTHIVQKSSRTYEIWGRLNLGCIQPTSNSTNKIGKTMYIKSRLNLQCLVLTFDINTHRFAEFLASLFKNNHPLLNLYGLDLLIYLSDPNDFKYLNDEWSLDQSTRAIFEKIRLENKSDMFKNDMFKEAFFELVDRCLHSPNIQLASKSLLALKNHTDLYKLSRPGKFLMKEIESYYFGGENDDLCFAALNCLKSVVNTSPMSEIYCNEPLWRRIHEIAKDSSPGCNLVISSLLRETNALFEIMNFTENCEVVWYIWDTAMVLLEDQDASVRSSVSCLVSHESFMVIAEQTRMRLMKAYVSSLLPKNGILCATVLVLWSLKEMVCEDLEQDEETQVFEKGESNLFAEFTSLNRLANEELRTIFKQLDQPKIEFIQQIFRAKRHMLEYLSTDNELLFELLKSYERKTSTCKLLSKLSLSARLRVNELLSAVFDN